MREANLFVGMAIVAAIFSASISQASTAEIPGHYRGIWTWSNSCDQTIEAWSKEPREFPFLVITGDETIQHETRCKIVSVTGGADTNKLIFKCFGEGEEWERKQTWFVRDKAVKIEGAMVSEDMTIKMPMLVVTAPDAEWVYRKCGAVCLQGECWGQ